jgi:hypothetical protein
MVIVRIAGDKFTGCGNDSQKILLETYGGTVGCRCLVGYDKGLAPQVPSGEAG